MKLISIIILILLFSVNIFAREEGQTEITTEDGIEVFQNEKFYLLKKNVNIKSDNFILDADNVKIEFDTNLYDIIKLDAEGNVKFDSVEFKVNGSGETLTFLVKTEELKIEGTGSELSTEEVNMFSDGYVEINNQNGKFSLKGLNSKLINETIFIEAESIDGIFSSNEINKEIIFLDVIDKNISYIKNNDTEMFAKKINFNENTSLIELIDNVTIIRDGEKITGDYGTLDTTNNSYKIKSNKKSKVKVIIKSNE
tara:strand:+ start:601 stop:1362 length:762 start_codon:yes stop_codon:yes gene_type:complete